MLHHLKVIGLQKPQSNHINTFYAVLPDNVSIYLQRGISYNEIREYENAMSDYIGVINKEPNNVP